MMEAIPCLKLRVTGEDCISCPERKILHGFVPFSSFFQIVEMYLDLLYFISVPFDDLKS